MATKAKAKLAVQKDDTLGYFVPKASTKPYLKGYKKDTGLPVGDVATLREVSCWSRDTYRPGDGEVKDHVRAGGLDYKSLPSLGLADPGAVA